jgi:hypothetical protein
MEDGNNPTPLLTAVAKLKRQLLLHEQPPGQGERKGPPLLLLSLWQVDLLHALVRLAGRLLLLLPSSTDEADTNVPAPAPAPALAFLQRAASALDLRGAWQEAAAAGGGGGEGGKTSSCLAWAARRVLVRMEAAVLGTLLSSSSSSSSSGPSSLLSAQARRLLPLCGPGQEWEARGLLLLGIDGDEEEEEEGGMEEKESAAATTLRRLFTSVLADEGALLHGRLLVGEEAPLCPTTRASLLVSPRLSPPYTLLPLPPHWLLLPLASSLAAGRVEEEDENEADQTGANTGAGAALKTTTRILHATLRFLLRPHDVWPSYTSLLPPGLPLYYLLCLGLFPYDAFVGTVGGEVRVG